MLKTVLDSETIIFSLKSHKFFVELILPMIPQVIVNQLFKCYGALKKKLFINIWMTFYLILSRLTATKFGVLKNDYLQNFAFSLL